MLKKILIPVAAIVMYTAPLQGQPMHARISFQLQRPSVHFQLDVGHNMHPSAYRTAYLKGYMDGVNSNYYYEHRFREMAENRRIYQAGYRDGMHDRALAIRLRGRRWVGNNCFNYQDYHKPYISVRLWLKNIRVAFSTRQLPRRRRRYRPRRPRRPRHWHPRRQYRRDDDYDEERYEEYMEEYEEEFEEMYDD